MKKSNFPKKLLSFLLDFFIVVSCASSPENGVIDEYLGFIDKFNILHERGDQRGIEALSDEITTFVENNKEYVLTENDKEKIAAGVLSLMMNNVIDFDSIPEESSEAKFLESFIKVFIYGTTIEEPVTLGDLTKADDKSLLDVLDTIKSDTGLTGNEDLDDDELLDLFRK